MILVALPGLAIYLFLCAAAIFCGRGIARIARLGLPAEAEWALAPVLSCLLWIVVLGVTGGLCIPIKWVAPFLWSASALLAVVGLRGVTAQWRRLLCPSLLCILLPIALMARTFVAGITETVATADCDGWAYASGALYLWDFPRGMPVPHSPVHHFGWLMKDCRWISYSLLAFLSPLYRVRDPLAIAGVYQAWSMFTLASAVYAFCVADQRNRIESIAVTTFTIVSGWMANLLWTNNFDNMLSTVFMPAAAAVLLFWEARQLVKWVLLGVVTACSLYTYPECTPFCLGPALLVAGPMLWKSRHEWRRLLLGGTLALVVALVLWAPGARVLLRFMLNVHSVAHWPVGRRPGDFWFGGLLHFKGHFAAAWGLGGECFGKPPIWKMNPVGMLLTLLLGTGAIRLACSRRWGLSLALTSLALAVCYVLFHLRYEYAAYKLIAFSWWCVVAVTISGVVWLLQRMPERNYKPWFIGSLFVLFSLCFWRATKLQHPLWSSPITMRAEQARCLRSLPPKITGEPFLLFVENWLPNLLALYHLQDVSFYPGILCGFAGEPGNSYELRKGITVNLGALRHVLADRTQPGSDLPTHGRMIWTSAPYYLWELGHAASDVTLIGVRNFVTGVQIDASKKPYFCLNHTPTDMFVYSTHSGFVQLTATFTPDPDPTDTTDRTVAVTTLNGYQTTQTLRWGVDHLHIPVIQGVNKITLSVPDQRTQSARASGPPPLQLKVSDFKLSRRYEAELLATTISLPATNIVADSAASGGQARFGDRRFTGCLVHGPQTALSSGRYQINYALRCNAPGSPESVATLDIRAEDRRIGPQRVLHGADFADADCYQTFNLTLDASVDLSAVEFRVLTHGRAEVWVDYIEVVPLSSPPAAATRPNKGGARSRETPGRS